MADRFSWSPVAGLVLGLALVVSFGGCEFFIEEVFPAYSISGEVINARTDSAKVGSAVVTLKNDAGSTVATQTTSTDGTFQFRDVSPGDYTISATRSGSWAFIDQEVSLAGEAITDVEVLGFESDDEYTISFFVVWEDSTDVDAYLSFPASYLGGGTPPVFTHPYQVTSVNGYAPTYNASADNELASSAADRYIVGWAGSGGFADAEASPTTLDDVYDNGTTSSVAEREREVQSGPGPETISLRGMPFQYYGGSIPSYNYATLGGGNTGLASGDYAWLGVAEYYIDAYGTGATLADEGSRGSTRAVVYVTQGTEVKGEFTIPDFTTLATAAVVRINLFERESDQTEVYQIVPDQRVVDPGFGVNSVTSSPTLVLTGRSR